MTAIALLCGVVTFPGTQEPDAIRKQLGYIACMLRNEQSDDISAIRSVHTAAFPAADEADLVERLRDGGNLVISLVKVIDEQIVGHIAFSPVTIEGSDVVGLGLAPVAVKPDHQRHGFGRELIEAGLLACREHDAPFVVVLGEPAYYTPFGFQPATNFDLDNEYGVGDEFMALEFTLGSLSGGTAKYCQQFQELA